MKLSNKGTKFRKWCRDLHREFSYLIAGILIVYAASGILMNHHDELNPHYTVSREVIQVGQALADHEQVTKEKVLEILKGLDEDQNYTKHYFPEANEMKVFLKGGSSLVVNTQTGEGIYEQLHKRFLLSDMVKLHYNPGRWWTTVSDIFAGILILVTLTGVLMIKGKKGLWGRGGVLLAVGILIPVLFLLL